MASKSLLQKSTLEDALRALERAAALLKEAGEPMAAMRVSAVVRGLK